MQIVREQPIAPLIYTCGTCNCYNIPMNRYIKGIMSGHGLLLTASGNSMLPLLCPGDKLLLKKTGFARVKTDDLILVNKKGDLIVHRVVYKGSGYVVTKGDNSYESDGRIYPKQILGKVVRVTRISGKGDRAVKEVFDPESLYLLQSTLYYREIVRIKHAFEKERIRHIFLKGLPLHLYYEKTHPKRMYADYDVLIDRESVSTVLKLLNEYGYKKVEMPLASMGPVIKNSKGEFSYIKRIKGFQVVLDVHTEPVFIITKIGDTSPLYPTKLIVGLTAKMLQTSRRVTINGERFVVLDTGLLIVYLAMHLFNHNFRGAYRYQFLDTVIRKSKGDGIIWNEITETVDRFRLGSFAFPVFMLLKRHYRTPVPSRFLKSIRPGASRSLYGILGNGLSPFDDETRMQSGVSRFKNLLYFSPEPWWRKMMIFTNPQVLFTIFWVLKHRLFSFFSGRR